MVLGSVCAARASGGLHLILPRFQASGVTLPAQRLCSHADLARVVAFMRRPVIDKQAPASVRSDTAGAPMPNTAESKAPASPVPGTNAGAGLASQDETSSQGDAAAKPEEPPAASGNNGRAVRMMAAPPASPPKRRAAPAAAADSTADARAKRLGGWSSTGKPYACHVCRRRYYSLEWLRRHVLTHERGKPLKCDRCGRSYMMRPALAKHKAQAHGV
ncbi:hypothetical protein HPB50_028218 [Hyalomma asiaticum]|nr:hypothetical protein HPB50_028218 [Hyalomma asiaticum]